MKRRSLCQRALEEASGEALFARGEGLFIMAQAGLLRRVARGVRRARVARWRFAALFLLCVCADAFLGVSAYG